MNNLLIVGSVAYDGLATPFGKVDRALGGSATYSSLAASLFVRTALVGVVGKDFRGSDLKLLRSHHINLDGLEVADGKTFYWKGVYSKDMNSRKTLKTDLNVFAGFDPKIPVSLRRAPFVFLANIHPALQMSVLRQTGKPRFTAMDTMNLWIQIARPALTRVLKLVDLIVLNDEEIRMLTGEYHLTKGARALARMGPKHVIVKKGEHGAMLFGPGWTFVSPAVPLDIVKDPTGAGDTFAGAFMGYLAKVGKVNADILKQAVIAGNLVASFTVQDFGVKRIACLTKTQLSARARNYHRFASIPKIKI
jgi:sugar/nucleoside kinase (ribokinase family)